MNTDWRKNNPFGQLREYELKNFVLDLEERGPHEKLHRLFLLENAEGRNAWYEAKAGIGLAPAYTADISHAWTVLNQQNKQQIAVGLPPDFGTELRYALTTALLTTGPTRPAGFATAFVQSEWWTPEEAVSYALHESSWQRRIVTLTALSRAVDGDWQLAAQKGALGSLVEGPAASRTAIGSSALSDREWAVSDYRVAAECLRQLVPTLADPLIDSALNAAKQIGNIWHYHAMSAVVNRLPDERKESEVESLWESASKYRASFWKAEALAIVAPLTVGEARAARMEQAAYFGVDVLGDSEGRRYRLQTPLTGVMLVGSYILVVRREDLRALSQIAPLLSAEQLQKALARTSHLSDEMREAAQSVLLPELWRAGDRHTALASTQEIKSVYFRSRAEAGLLSYGCDDLDALSRLLTEVDLLQQSEERTLCRAALARFLAPAQRCPLIASVLKDLEQQSDAPLKAAALSDLRSVFEDVPPGERAPVVNSMLAIASSSFSGNQGDEDFLGCALVPYLDRSSIRKEYDRGREIEIKLSEKEVAERLRTALSVKPIKVRRPDSTAETVSVAQLAGALKAGIHLSPAHQSRAITLAAQLANDSDLTTLADAAATIENEFMRTFALYALMERSAGETQCRIALQLLDGMLALHGGLAGAAPFFQGVSAALRARRREIYESCSTFAHSLSQADIDVALQDILVVAPVWQPLTGPTTTTDALTPVVTLLKRWWGKRGPAAQPENAAAHEEPRFEWQAVPDESQAIAVELIGILAGDGAFDIAEHFMKQITDVSLRDPAWEGAAESTVNSLLSQCAAAGEIDRCLRLSQGVKSLRPQTACDMARAYIQYGRLDDAVALCSSSDHSLQAETVWPAGLEVIEALAAEVQPQIALNLFANLVSSGVPDSVSNYFIDSYFVVGNAVIKSQERPLAEYFIAVLKGTPLLPEVCEKTHKRLVNYATALEQQGQARRANAWRMFSDIFTKTEPEH